MSNENEVLYALDNLLTDNKVTLVNNLSRNGLPREIGQITRSSLTVIQKYFYIALDITQVTEQTIPDKNMPTMSNALREERHTVIVTVVDDAYPQTSDEDEVFEKLHTDFRLLTDRIVDLINQQAWITGPNGGKYQLLKTGKAGDKTIKKINLSGIYPEGGEYPLFVCQIEFTLAGRCPDRTLLYPS